jgi:hypothetical protein
MCFTKIRRNKEKAANPNYKTSDFLALVIKQGFAMFKVERLLRITICSKQKGGGEKG